MEILGSVSTISAGAILRRAQPCAASVKRTTNLGARSKPDGGIDPLFEAAIKRASLRFRESHKLDPLFIDPYAGCLVSSKNIQLDIKSQVPWYCLATMFIDDKLLSSLKNDDELRQVILLADGMDTRPYRLNWPRSTLILDVSPERVFRAATLELEGVGAKIRRSCSFIHIPSESSDIEEMLRKGGFKGTRPSLWVLQGLPVVNLESFKEILYLVSNLAAKGSLFLGELPCLFSETEGCTKSSKNQSIDNLFMRNGFRVVTIGYDELARDFRKEMEKDIDKYMLFIAEQLLFSDDQMETWRREFQRIEGEADEEGFEEL